jgi:2-(1,2-epoxy-1,2-dihydrophenyl)acetyl-CoA isomerase
MFKTLLVDSDAGAMRIRLNRPDVLNALTLELLTELKEALTYAAGWDDIRAVLLTGEGRGFCAGADLASNQLGDEVQTIVENYYNPVVQLLATMPKPVIAAVNGVAAGAGMSLALACDMRVVSSSASFSLGFTGIGLALDASASYFLPRLVGRGRALEIAYSGRKINAEEAITLGLAETLLPAETFAETAWLMTKQLAQGPTKTFALVKEQLNASETNTLEEQLRLEARLQAKAAKTADAAEGIRAFAEKRKPSFKGQ